MWRLGAVLAFIGLLGCIVGGCQRSEGPRIDRAAEKAAIRKLLHAQVAAWNEGSLEDFMAGYARSDSLRFASGGTVRTGWDSTLARYRNRYPNRAAMGTLSFDRVDIQILSPRSALVFGAWRLERAEDAPHGLFTLIMTRHADGWHIVHDHTSSAS